MTNVRLTTAGVALDAWRAARGGAPAIALRQSARLARLVAHARSRSPFYAEHYRAVAAWSAGDHGLPLLPPVAKPALMERFNDWVTDPAITRTAVEAFVADLDNVGKDFVGEDFLGSYVVFTTSGSTGVPALLVQDSRAMAVMAGLAYARSSPFVTPALAARMVSKGSRLAAVFAPGGHFLTATMFERRARKVPLRHRFARYFSVLEPLPVLVEQLDVFQPALLATYASALAVLTEEQAAGRLRISPLVIVVGGELLLPEVRRRAESVFSCAVLETYSASEATPLALPCRGGRLHVNSDWFILEPVDAGGRPVPPGIRSDSVLLTNLANYVQPVIRYQLGDSVVMDEDPCACGSPLPAIRVEGRTDDVLRVPRTGGGELLLLPMALTAVVEETAGVYRYQIVQTAPDALTVRLETDPGTDGAAVWERVRNGLQELLHGQGAAGVRVSRAPEPPQMNPRSGKLRQVVGMPSS